MILIVYSHHEPTSFNRALLDTAVQPLTDMGHDASVHDQAPNTGPDMTAYVTVVLTVTDTSWIGEDVSHVRPITAKYGGKPALISGPVEVIEGDTIPSQVATCPVPSIDALKAFMVDPDDLPWKEARQANPYRKTFELAALAEEAGFKFISVPHHSFTPDTQDYAAPLIMMAALAARTATIRIVSTIFIMPLHQPLAVAEQFAELDRLSGGRTTFGVAAGYRDYEFAGHGVNIKTRGKRMDEMLTIIRRGFEAGYFEFKGDFFDIPRSVVAPLPVQTPHPPLWIGGHTDSQPSPCRALRRRPAIGKPLHARRHEGTGRHLASRLRRGGPQAGGGRRHPQRPYRREPCLDRRGVAA